MYTYRKNNTYRTNYIFLQNKIDIYMKKIYKLNKIKQIFTYTVDKQICKKMNRDVPIYLNDKK